jgi:hypothetical protein
MINESKSFVFFYRKNNKQFVKINNAIKFIVFSPIDFRYDSL